MGDEGGLSSCMASSSSNPYEFVRPFLGAAAEGVSGAIVAEAALTVVDVATLSEIVSFRSSAAATVTLEGLTDVGLTGEEGRLGVAAAVGAVLIR